LPSRMRQVTSTAQSSSPTMPWTSPEGVGWATYQRFRTHHGSSPRDRWTAREGAPCKTA
jgi:hypothetical protein